MYNKDLLKVITGSTHMKQTQHGYDLSVKDVYPIFDNNPLKIDDNYFKLQSGLQYLIVPNENINGNYTQIRHRSSINRCGGWITPFVEDDELFLIIQCTENISIEKNSRVAQIIGKEFEYENIISTHLLPTVSVKQVNGGVISNSTAVNPYSEVEIKDNKFSLIKGKTYAIETSQGCDIKYNELGAINFSHQSYNVHSPIFDAGFKTDKITYFLYCRENIEVTLGETLCSLDIFRSVPIKELYNGQFQGK